jgi:hypothetical protein
VQVDPAGLVAAAQRLTAALAGLSGGQPVHPPLGADPASTGGAARLSGAGAELVELLTAQVHGLIGTAHQVGLTGAGLQGVDEANAALIAALDGRAEPVAMPGGPAPVAPAVPADVRAPLPGVPAAGGEALAVAVHAGDPAAGDDYTQSWQRVAAAAADAAGTVRAVAAGLAEVLDSPQAAPAVSAHLQRYADGFEAAAGRAAALADQADEHAAQRVQAGRDIPTPEQFAQSRALVARIAVANARSGGRFAVALAQAEAAHRSLESQAVSGYATYHAATDLTTGAGDPAGDPGSPGAVVVPGVPGDEDGGAEPGDPGAAVGAAESRAGGGSGVAGDGGVGALAGESGALAELLPSMIPAVLGAAGGLLGGLMSSVTALPQAAAQAGTQAVSAGATALSGALAPALAGTRSAAGVPAAGAGGGAGGVGDLGGIGAAVGGLGDGFGDVGAAGGIGGRGATTPAAGTLPPATLAGSVAPAPPDVPAGGAPAGSATGGGPGGAMVPLGMPVGGAGAAGGKKDNEKPKRVVVEPIPHTEEVTGKITGNRVAVSAITAEPNSAEGGAVVKRITGRPGGDEAS